MNRTIRKVDTTSRTSFINSFAKLPNDFIKKEVTAAIIALLADPQPARLHFEKFAGRRKPPIYTIHATSDDCYKVSFELFGDVAIMRRVGSHKTIDRRP